MPDGRKRRRGWTVALGAVVALFVLGALAARHYTRPEALTALLVDGARTQLGAELSLGGTGRFEFFPDLHLVLPRPALRQSEQQAPFASAAAADIVVPWSILWSGRYEIRRVELVEPTLDLDALDRWLASRPSGGKLPEIRFALRASGATIVSHGKPVASGVDLAFASAGDLAAWFDAKPWRSSSAALLPPLDGTAKAASIEIGGTRIEGVRVEARDDGDADRAAGRP